MIRNRLVLCLMMKGELFMNSRQFLLNPVGNLETILQYLHFDAVDEIVVLNVQRGAKDMSSFARHLRDLLRVCFVPVAAGGGVRSLEHCQALLNAGADKIVVNSAVVEDPDFVRAAANRYGSQCIVHSIDVRRDRGGRSLAWIHDGTVNSKLDPVELAKRSEELGVGEIFLTSIDRDGTCQGYDIPLVRSVVEAVGIPVITSGGVGDFRHLVEGVKDGGATAVSAGNIFHFIGHGLTKAKAYVRDNGLNFPDPLWNFQRDHKL